MIGLMLHEVRVRRRTMVGWALGLGFFTIMYMSFYPSLPDELLNLDMGSIEIYQSLGVDSMATFQGYMQSTVLNFVPLLVGAFGIVLGVGALAGEEDSGTLELLAALPISRLQLYFAKAAAIVFAAFLALLAVASATAAVFLAMESQIATPVTALDLFRVLTGHWLVAFIFLALGLFLGSLLPTRGSALAAGSALLVVSFFANNLAGMVTELETVQPLFPFSYFGRFADALTGDVPWDDVLILMAMGAVFLALGAASFRARDLTVAAWPWQRAQPADERSRPISRYAVTGLVTVVAAVAIALAALAVSNDGDLRFWEGDTEVGQESDASVDETVAASDEDATGTAVAATAITAVEATPTRAGEAEETSTGTTEAAPPAATQVPGEVSGEAIRATATLRILP